uniref:Uncharacterized protein n=1 Tax=Solanum lycopersicum TaxID=4081 RepID=A0A3Q7G1Y2_SOLLC
MIDESRVSATHAELSALGLNTYLIRINLISSSLYKWAERTEETLKIYDGVMHSLLFAKTDENIEVVHRDILAWLNNRY